MWYNDSLPDGDAPSSEEPAQSVESSTFERGTAADITDDVPKGDVLDLVVGKDTVAVPVNNAVVRNVFGDVVG